MTRQLLIVGVTALCLGCCGGKNKAPNKGGDTKEPGTSKAGLCKKLSDVKGKAIDYQPEDVENALAPDSEKQTIEGLLTKKVGTEIDPLDVITVSGMTVATYADCEKGCVAGVVAIAKGKTTLSGHAAFSRVTEAKGYSESGGQYVFTLKVVPIDALGDGTKELWVSYAIYGKQVPGIGPPSVTYLAILSLPSLTVLWEKLVDEDKAMGNRPVDRGCKLEFRGVDVTCDGKRDLVVSNVCTTQKCDGPGGEKCVETGRKATHSAFAWTSSSAALDKL